MRLYLAVAVLMLAFVAYTEAQDQDPDQALDQAPDQAPDQALDQEQEQTIKQRFSNFGEQVAEVGKNLAEKAKTTFEDIQSSKFATNSRDWFQTQIDNLKAKLA